MFRTIVSRLRRLGALGLMLLLALGAHAATAQTGPTIRDVVVEGNQRIEVATVQNYLTLHAGSAYSAAEADKRSEEHTSELQSLMRISYAVFCLKKKKHNQPKRNYGTTVHMSQPTA